MIGQVISNAWKVDENIDASLLKYGRRSDTGELEKLRRIDGSTTHDNLFTRLHRVRSAIDCELNTGGLYMLSMLLELDFRDQRMGDESQVWSIRVGLIITSRSIASPVMLRVDGTQLVEAADR
jgi:hypothetical protein